MLVAVCDKCSCECRVGVGVGVGVEVGVRKIFLREGSVDVGFPWIGIGIEIGQELSFLTLKVMMMPEVSSLRWGDLTVYTRLHNLLCRRQSRQQHCNATCSISSIFSIFSLHLFNPDIFKTTLFHFSMMFVIVSSRFHYKLHPHMYKTLYSIHCLIAFVTDVTQSYTGSW